MLLSFNYYICLLPLKSFIFLRIVIWLVGGAHSTWNNIFRYMANALIDIISITKISLPTIVNKYDRGEVQKN